MKEKFPKKVYLFKENKYTFKDENGKLWDQRFLSADWFSEGLAAVELDNGWTFVNKQGKVWPQRFKYAYFFSKGLAAVELDDGWTFVNKDGKVWSQRFDDLANFAEELTVVKLNDGSWTIVDVNGNMWDQRYKDAAPFSGGLAPVKLDNDGWTFVDRNGKVWDQRFKYAYCFSEGLAEVRLKDGQLMCVDKAQRMFTTKQGYILGKIYTEPSEFLELPTEAFRDENFVAGAVLKVKEALLQPIEDKADVIDDYAKYCEEFLAEVKAKKERELATIAEQEREKQGKEQKKTDLKDRIKNFDI